MLGAANVTEGETTIGDAGPMPCTKVFAKKPDSSLTIVWEESKRNRQIGVIEFCRVRSRPTTSATGASPTESRLAPLLKTLEKMNGRPFKIFDLRIYFGKPV
jgi:hypothetical protein